MGRPRTRKVMKEYPTLDRSPQTIKRLKRIYNKNFKILMKLDHPRHKRAGQRERALDKMSTKLRVEMGIHIHAQCPVKTASHCSSCTGWYNRKYSRNIMMDQGEGTECGFSRYANLKVVR